MSSSDIQSSSGASDLVITNSAPLPERSPVDTFSETNPKDASGGNGTEEVTSVFRNLSADDPDPEITEIESLCVQCGGNGLTKLMLTKIPFYKEVVLMSFKCNDCDWENNELQSAAQVQEKGVEFKLNVKTTKDLTRQVVKTEWASVTVPELEFEIPPRTQDGTVTTIEGILQRALDGLQTKLTDPEVKDTEHMQRLKTFLFNLRNLIKGNVHFTFVLRDCSGNSFVENIFAPHGDPEMEITHFDRTKEENALLGIASPTSSLDHPDESSATEDSNFLKEEVLQFPTNCPHCSASTFTNMKVTQIPHFKDVIIMATTCSSCGHRTAEVKSGGGIQSLGKKISVKVTNLADLKRDLVKSETCSILIPELELEVGAAALGGRYTTVEGLLTNVKEQLSESNPLLSGDSASPEKKQQMEMFLSKLDEVINATRTVTLILDDPCGNSYLEHLSSPGEDSNVSITEYQRTKEQEDELGISDMKTENYGES